MVIFSHMNHMHTRFHPFDLSDTKLNNMWSVAESFFVSVDVISSRYRVPQEKKETSRKQIKEAKNRSKKIRGTGRRIAKHKAKKAAK